MGSLLSICTCVITDISKRTRQYAVYYSSMIVKVVVVALLAGLSTYFSYRADVTIDLQGNDIVTVAVVFPLVFSMNAAYNRRQDALARLASLKGHTLALRLCFAHWAKEHRQPVEILSAADVLMDKFFNDLKCFLSHKKLAQKVEEDIVNTFTALSLLIEKLRGDSVSSPDLSRANEFLRNMMVDFETMKNFHIYRTPSSLLLYTKCFLFLIPVVYGPVFANIAVKSGGLGYGIFLAVLYAVVLITLANTQDVLENPYDGLSPDDIQFRHPTTILKYRVSRSWSEAVPYLPLLAKSRDREDPVAAEESPVHSPISGGSRSPRQRASPGQRIPSVKADNKNSD